MAEEPNYYVVHNLGHRSDLYIDPNIVREARHGDLDQRAIICDAFYQDAKKRWTPAKVPLPKEFVWDDFNQPKPVCNNRRPNLGHQPQK